jgi:hypothetical protein
MAGMWRVARLTRGTRDRVSEAARKQIAQFRGAKRRSEERLMQRRASDFDRCAPSVCRRHLILLRVSSFANRDWLFGMPRARTHAGLVGFAEIKLSNTSAKSFDLNALRR